MSVPYGCCAMCKFCHQFIGKGADNKKVTAYYCRKNPPKPSQVAVAMSGAMVVTKGLWPSVDPDMDGCAEFIESDFS